MLLRPERHERKNEMLAAHFLYTLFSVSDPDYINQDPCMSEENANLDPDP